MDGFEPAGDGCARSTAVANIRGHHLQAPCGPEDVLTPVLATFTILSL